MAHFWYLEELNAATKEEAEPKGSPSNSAPEASPSFLSPRVMRKGGRKRCKQDGLSASMHSPNGAVRRGRKDPGKGVDATKSPLRRNRSASGGRRTPRRTDSQSTVTTVEMNSSSSFAADSLPLMQQNPLGTVQFDMNHEIHVVKGRKEYTKEEHNSIWFTRSDFKQSKEEIRSIIQRHAEQSIAEYEIDCLRGLEHRLKGHNKFRQKAIKKNSINAVLAEQARKEHTRRSIKKIYQEYNKPSIEEAIERGLMDQRAIMNDCCVPKRRMASVDLSPSNLDELEQLAIESSKHRRATAAEVKVDDEISLGEIIAQTDDTKSNKKANSSFTRDNFGEDFLDDFNDSMMLGEQVCPLPSMQGRSPLPRRGLPRQLSENFSRVVSPAGGLPSRGGRGMMRKQRSQNFTEFLSKEPKMAVSLNDSNGSRNFGDDLLDDFNASFTPKELVPPLSRKGGLPPRGGRGMMHKQRSQNFTDFLSKEQQPGGSSRKLSIYK